MLPKNLQISPPGTRVLELVDREVARLQALPWGHPIPPPRPLSFDAEVVHGIAKLEASIQGLGKMLNDADRPPGVSLEQVQTALADDLAYRAALREDLVQDMGGYLLWIWVFADASITRGSRRFPQ